MQDRRQFLQYAALASLGTAIHPESWFMNSKPLKKIGIQLFSVPKMLDTNFEGTLAMLAQLGFKELELYGPYPFSTEGAKKSWEAIIPMVGFKGSGFFGKSIQEIGALMKKYKFSVPAMHTDLDTLATNMGPLAEAANALGATYVILPSIPDENRKTLDDYKRTAAMFNKIGAEAKKYGIHYAYHNHGYGLYLENGKMPLDIIFDETDPSLVFFEMDVYWTSAGGADPIALLNKHKGRYTLIHIKDMKEKKRFSGDGGNPAQWVELFPFMSAAGDGVLNLPGIIEAAMSSGVKHFIVEQDMVAEPEITLKRSISYLHGL